MFNLLHIHCWQQLMEPSKYTFEDIILNKQVPSRYRVCTCGSVQVHSLVTSNGVDIYDNWEYCSLDEIRILKDKGIL